MYFTFQIEFSSKKSYISSLIKAYSKSKGVEVDILQNGEQIAIIGKESGRLERFMRGLGDNLPASIYLGRSREEFFEKKPKLSNLVEEYKIAHNIAPCPKCQKEMFDISSPRYYYPFTSCNNCGSQHQFLENYPFIRENTTMRFYKPCSSCEKELKENPFRENYPLISCIECGIKLKMEDGKSKRYANDKGSFKRLFEVSAKALNSGKRVIFKTLNGYREFFKPTDSSSRESILMVTSANRINSHLMMVQEEFNALLSIERPILRVATKSEELKEIYGSTLLVKYPDEGISMLLAKELLNLGLEYISYIERDSRADAGLLVDFDTPISFQKDIKLFINQDRKFIISGSRGIFPLVVDKTINSPYGIDKNSLVAVNFKDITVIDNIEKFKNIDRERLKIVKAPIWKSSTLALLAEHNYLGKKAVGVHFDKSLYFLYYNGKEVICVVPPNPFDADNLFDNISKLREGSDRLVSNYKKLFPKIYKRLKNLTGESDIFTITAIILELKDESFEGISAKALEFMGKGGIQIDTHIKDNRFDNYPLLASIMSYKIAGVEDSLICYSIFESFGEYIGEITSQLISKTKSKAVTFTGETFANQPLFGKVEKGLARIEILLPKSLPIGRESATFGGLFL